MMIFVPCTTAWVELFGLNQGDGPCQLNGCQPLMAAAGRKGEVGDQLAARLYIPIFI